MEHHLARLLLLTTAMGGCSKLYDPERLPASADAKPDAPPDIFPCDLTIEDVSPAIIVEGAGTGGSRQALIVISGSNIVMDNTTVTITVGAGSARAPMVMVDNAKLEVGSLGQHLAVPITLPVDPALPESPTARVEMIPLDLAVTQACAGGEPVTRPLAGKLVLKTLPELKDANVAPLLGETREYSQIDVATATLAPMGGQTSAIILRSTSSARIVNNISVDAAGRNGGPAGGTGGTGGMGLGGVGTPGTGPTPGLTSGAPGGFDNSDPGLNTLGNPNRGSGGAGGDGAVVGNGGNGGGGGGSIEISAGGDLEVGAIHARGAAGVTSGAGADGGGGSGGVILLRAGGTLTAGDIDVRSLGTGAPGRARYDAGGIATVTLDPDNPADHLRGPMFTQLPFAFREARPSFMVAGKPLSAFKYFFLKPGGGVSSVSSALFDGTGAARVTPSDELEPGASQLCLITESGTPSSQTRNCADIAYLP